MVLNPAAAKVSEIQVSWDAAAVATASGPVFWATVEIRYALADLKPDLAIRVPVACDGNTGSEACRRQALQSARSLLNHACGAPALSVAGEEPVLEGLSQELGLTPPATRPRRGGLR
jgi:hypothetical protein